MEIKKLNINAINNFWVWFSDNHKDFGANFENNELLSELDDRINELGEYVWEVGPGIKSANQLVISPGGDIDLLSDTKEIISYAPILSDWSFYYAKPPKQWELLFNFEKEDGSITEIDARCWSYVLFKYDDGMVEVIIQTCDLNGFSEEDKLTITEILIDGIIGEENRMLYICNIEVVKEFEEKYKMKSNNIKTLSQFIPTAIL